MSGCSFTMTGPKSVTATFTAMGPTGNWTMLPSGVTSHLRAVHFVNDNEGWAVGFSPGPILHTTNGGASWESQAGPISGSLTGVYFANSNEGWATYAGDRAVIHTTDGGLHWAVQYDGVLNGIGGLWWITGVDSLHLWAAATSGLLITSDGGSAWQHMPMNPPGYRLRFLDAQVGWAAGNYGVVRTTDAGNTWVSKYPGSGDAVVTDVAIVGDRVWGVGALPTYKIVHSSNGGATWQDQTTNITQYLNAIRFIDAINGWAVGENGSILSTTGRPVLICVARQTWPKLPEPIGSASR
jgi:photosystem II stability/assembly factor-like uncharacterized protein